MVSLKAFVFLIPYYEFCGNPVVMAGLNHFTTQLSYILLVIRIIIAFPMNNSNRYLLSLLCSIDRILL